MTVTRASTGVIARVAEVELSIRQDVATTDHARAVRMICSHRAKS
jgi:hypothetical protein